MADKVEKPKKSKSKPRKDEKGVLAALPSTRAERIGTRRASAPRAGGTKTSTAAEAGGAKAPAATRPTAAKTTATANQPVTPRATATRRKAAAPRTFEPTRAAETAAGAADERAAGAVPRAAATPAPEPRPRAVRPAAPGMGTSGEREQASHERGRPSGMELVTTAVQAAGELTQIGLTIGGQIIKRAVNKLPKP